MKIPSYDPQARDQEAQAPAPPTFGAAPAAAFGTGIAEQTQRLGSTVEDAGTMLANHMIEREHARQTSEVISADNQFRTTLQKDMFDTTPDDNGVPKGVFNRMGKAAAGATEEFDQSFAARRQASIDAMDSPYKKQRLGELMDENYPRLRELVAKHEGTQVRVGQTADVDGHNLHATQTAPIYFGDPNGLIKAINVEQQLKHNDMVANGLDGDKIVAATNDQAAKMVLSSIRPSLHANPLGAQDFFDSINENRKNPLDPAAQGKIQDIIDDSIKRFRTHQKTFLDTRYDQGEAAASGKLANGELTLDDLQNMKADNQVSPDYFNIASVALKNPPVDSPDDKVMSKQNSEFDSTLSKFAKLMDVDSDKRTGEIMKLRKEIIASSDHYNPSQFKQVLGWTDPNFIAKMDPEKLSQFQAAIKFLREHLGNFSQSSTWKTISNFMSNAISPGVKTEDIPGLAQKAAKQATLQENPSLMGHPDVSNNIIDQKKGINQIYESPTNLKPAQTIKGPIANPPKKGEKRGGFTFQGGDPSNPKNWVKQ